MRGGRLRVDWYNRRLKNTRWMLGFAVAEGCCERLCPSCPSVRPTELRPHSQPEMYVMHATELIAKFLEERLGAEPSTIIPTALLTDLGVDSLMLAELMFEAEDHLGISIDADAAIPKTVGEMVTLIEGLLAAKSFAS